MLRKLQEINPELSIKDMMSSEFARYGRNHPGIRVPEMKKFVTGVPRTEKECYIPCAPELMSLDESDQFTDGLFGQVPCQIGYYYGWGTKLNAVEYHKCSEILVTFEPSVLILGSIWDIENQKLDSSRMKLFYIPADTCVELYATTLHFSPCMVTKRGVCQIVVQSSGTNTPLEREVKNREGENRYLLEKNKWVLIHPDFVAEMDEKSYAGIVGQNITVVPISE